MDKETREALDRANRLIEWMSGYIGSMAPGSYANAYAELNEHHLFMASLRPMATPPKPDGEGWHHRIDAVPALHRNVEIVRTHGNRQRAVTQEYRDGFAGIGGDVGYRTPSGVVSARLVAWWRYELEARR